MESLLDVGGAVRNALALGNLQESQRRNDLTSRNADLEQQRLEQEDSRLRQNAVFRGFSEVDKLAESPAFSTPGQQVKLRLFQANLIRDGLGMKEMPVPDEAELMGGMDQFTKNLRLFVNGGSPDERRAAFAEMATAMPEYTGKLLDDMKKMGELDVQGEQLRVKLETDKANLKALNLKYSRAAIQQGLYSEHAGALARSQQLLDAPEFQPHFRKIQSLSPEARQAYLAANPKFAQAFDRAIKPQLETFGGVDQAFEEAFGEDVQPRLLSGLKQEVDAKRQSRQEVFERDGEIPAEMDEEIGGLELVRKAREVQYAWMKDPFNPEKIKLLKKAQSDIKAASAAAGKTMGDVQDERLAFQQTKFDAEQQAKRAEDYAQERKMFYLNSGHKEEKAAFLASKDVGEKFPDTPYGAEKLQPKKALVENKIVQTQEKEEAKQVGGGFGKQYITLQESDMASRSKLSKYDRMGQLLQQINTGKVEPTKTSIQAFADSLGISVDKSLPAKQAFEALSNEIALTLRNPAGGAGMPGALSDKDREFLQGMTPNLSKTPEGNRMIIETARKLAQRDMEVAKMAREYRKKRGQFDEGFFDELDKYSQAHPLFQEKSVKGSKSPSTKSGAVLNALPQGSKQIGTSGGKPVYEDATGKRWIGE